MVEAMKQKAIATKQGLRWIDIALTLLVAGVGLYVFTSQPEKNIYAVMDQSEVIQSRLDAGDSPVEALVYFNILRDMYEHKGVVVFDKEALVTYPKEFEAVLPSQEALFEMSIKAGKPVNRAVFEDAQRELDKQREAMRKALNLQ
jgi:hypothetical protein